MGLVLNNTTNYICLTLAAKMKSESTWRISGEWKSRYSQLYSCRRLSMPTDEAPRCISFMENDSSPYSELLMKLRSSRPIESGADDEPIQSPVTSATRLRCIMSRQSEMYPSYTGSITGSLGRHDTMLLDMVRERNRELQEAQDQPLELPGDDASEHSSSEPYCMHGLSHRVTDRSVSRSRFSRISTRRDMDIPSILAFTTTDAPPLNLPLGIPAFQTKVSLPKCEEIPRWSIRRAVCPVCSQKWRDRSSIDKIKSSGLKRNALLEIPSVIAPARLRSAILKHTLRPIVEDVEDSRQSRSLRNSSAGWQLIRARRVRTPKPQPPPPEATQPVAQPPNHKDLDSRVNNFLSS